MAPSAGFDESEAWSNIEHCFSQYKPATVNLLNILFNPQTGELRSCREIRAKVEELQSRGVPLPPKFFQEIERAIRYRNQAAIIYETLFPNPDARMVKINQGHRAYIALLRWMATALQSPAPDTPSVPLLKEGEIKVQPRGPGEDSVQTKKGPVFTEMEDALKQVDSEKTVFENDSLTLVFGLLRDAEDILDHMRKKKMETLSGKLGLTTLTTLYLAAYESIKSKCCRVEFAFELNGWGELSVRSIVKILHEFHLRHCYELFCSVQHLIKGGTMEISTHDDPVGLKLMKDLLDLPETHDADTVQKRLQESLETKTKWSALEHDSTLVQEEIESMKTELTRSGGPDGSEYFPNPVLQDMIKIATASKGIASEIAVMIGLGIHVLMAVGRMTAADPQLSAAVLNVGPACLEGEQNARAAFKITMYRQGAYKTLVGWRKDTKYLKFTKRNPDIWTTGIRLAQLAVTGLETLHTCVADVVAPDGRYSPVPGLLLMVDFLNLKGAKMNLPEVDELLDFLRSIVYPFGKPTRLEQFKAFHALTVKKRGLDSKVKADFYRKRLECVNYCLLVNLFNNNFRMRKGWLEALGYPEYSVDVGNSEATIQTLSAIEASLTKQFKHAYIAGKVVMAAMTAVHGASHGLEIFADTSATAVDGVIIGKAAAQKELERIYTVVESILKSEIARTKLSDPRFFFVDLKQEPQWADFLLRLQMTSPTEKNIPLEGPVSLGQIREMYYKYLPSEERTRQLRKLVDRFGVGEMATWSQAGGYFALVWDPQHLEAPMEILHERFVFFKGANQISIMFEAV